METLAHASINQLMLVSLCLEPCCVSAEHRFVMQSAPVKRFVYVTQGNACFYLRDGVLQVGVRDMVYLPRDTAYQSKWLTETSFVVVDLLLRNRDGQDIRFGDLPSVLFHDTHRVYDGLLAELADMADADGPLDWLESGYPSPLSCCVKWRGIPTGQNRMKPTAVSGGGLPIWRVTIQAGIPER